MKSQVSFKFDGRHNQRPILNILKESIKNLNYKIETESRNVYKIYVAGSCGKEDTFNVCRGIQCNSILDNNKNL